jgi:RNA polymerase sigma factor (sigma-70 family)
MEGDVPAGTPNALVPQLRDALLRADEAGLTDGQLLERFVGCRDGAALDALVRRHGPMVWGVCRRILRDHHDAEDAFQATFLVLVRKAATIRPREMVANWLYGVARQTALKARAMAARRRARERPAAETPEPQAAPGGPWDDLLSVLDQELSRLPTKYRVAIVLCDIEGKTRKEVAGQLRLSEGTVASRLARARALLAERLARHGPAVSAAALPVLLQQAAARVPPGVVSCAVTIVNQVAAGQPPASPVSATVTALTDGVLRAMWRTKLKTVAAALLILGLLVAGVSAYATRAAEPLEQTRDTGAASDPGVAVIEEAFEHYRVANRLTPVGSDGRGQVLAPPDLKTVITNVRAAEALYADLDVSYRCDYRLNPDSPFAGKPGPGSTIIPTLTSTSRFRSVTQGERFYLDEVKEETGTNGKTTTRRYTTGYDGKLTRVLDDNVANLHHGRANEYHLFRPHVMILARAWVSFPFSLWLEGGETLSKHRLAGHYRGINHKTFVEGEEKVNGLDCVKLRCEGWGASEKSPTTIRYLWLAPERNYMPVKTVAYAPIYSETIPLETGTASSFREIKPGVWLSFKCSLTINDEIEAREHKWAVLSNSEEWTVQRADANPKLDAAFFRDVPFPKGAVVYEVKDGKIISSHVEGEDK